MAVGEDVYCTLCMSDNYLPGAAVLAKSLRDTGTTKKLAVLIDQERLRPSTVTELQSLYNYTIPIPRIGNPAPANLYLMNRPDLLYTFTKIHLWRLTQFRKIVYIDSDVVCLRAPDELFALDTPFAAAPDVGWPDAFNTGVMVITPNMGDYYALHTLAEAGDSFDGADQGLLNQYFEHKDWTRLSFVYNCTPSANYQYEPAYRYYKRDIRMVHFIGREKPWQRDRSIAGAPGAFQELLGRWWAVYDRHFKVSAAEYIESGRREPLGQAVRQEVDRHQKPADATYYATGYPTASTPPAPPPSIAVQGSTEIPFTEPGEEAENIDQGYTEPQPTVELRRFSAPHAEWDATRTRPPVDSRPEAANFPTQTYEFSTDPKPWVPPKAYPEPPKDLWYEVPKEKPREEKLTPMFPWEEREEHPKPTRRFFEEEKKPPPVETMGIGEDEFSVQSNSSSFLEPKTPTIRVNDTWNAFGASGKNAWDEVAGIEDYVRALTKFQKQRGKVEVLHPTNTNQSETKDLIGTTQPAGVSSPTPQPPPSRAGEPQTHILSPSNEMEPEALIEAVTKRRESLILTDFPSAVERPSLPVTPAPRRRTTFWGSDGGEKGGESEEGDGRWVKAEGVVEQGDWDPNAQLDQLRRNSLMGPGDLKLTGKKVIPNREMVTHHLESVEEAPAVKKVSAPVFAEPDFSVKASQDEPALEDVLSPTEAAAS